MTNLGCAKNEVDAEEMLAVLSSAGYPLECGKKPPDVEIINTCGFIESARQESIDAILEAIERKKQGLIRKVVVTGCLSQRYAKELAQEMPEVDAFLGAGQMAQIARTVGDTFITSRQALILPRKPHHVWLDSPIRVRTGSPWTAWLKISEGCNHRCTFCSIPSMRGEHVSKPIDRILEEARELVRMGARELNLIAQDSTQYGYDLCGRSLLPELLRRVAEVEGAHWIRLFYCYPSRVNSELINTISQTPGVCQYIDIPLQHADSAVLRAMLRPGSAESYLSLLTRFRAASPDVAIRTTFIVGFPGETEEQFSNLLRFIEQAQFDRAGVFEYSLEEGTPSYKLEGRVPARTRRVRMDRLMRLQQEISLERNRRWIGREMEVLIERSETPPQFEAPVNAAVGRTFRDAPDIDGSVYVTGATVQPGNFINVRITDARPYDLIAEALPLSTKRERPSEGG